MIRLGADPVRDAYAGPAAPLRVMYGNAPATARFDGARRWLTVSLDTDPGTGSMVQTRISPTVVGVVSGTREDVATAAAIYRNAVRYLTPGPTAERLTREAGRLELLAGVDRWAGAGCTCPGDCACRMPAWMSRPVSCGCRQH